MFNIFESETLRRAAEAGDTHGQAHYGSALMQWPEVRAEGLKWPEERKPFLDRLALYKEHKNWRE